MNSSDVYGLERKAAAHYRFIFFYLFLSHRSKPRWDEDFFLIMLGRDIKDYVKIYYWILNNIIKINWNFYVSLMDFTCDLHPVATAILHLF